MLRSHTCGEIALEHQGLNVTLIGWMQRSRDLGGLFFLDLRDRYGLVQIVIDPNSQPELTEKARRISRESVISVQGDVRPRPQNMVNPNMTTGAVEVVPSSITVHSEAADLPIPMDDIVDAGEELRLKYRYLELRRPAMQKNLELRHKAAQSVRRFLDSQGFWEIETPYLMKSTPEGARDFIVPSRINKGRFYALPQSPQTYKQILMVSGCDRYFQIVRCFRDEDFRADRQPEFTQIDLEMSFVQEEDIYALIEKMMTNLFKDTLNIDIPLNFPRISFADAMRNYGSDKPDIRFGCELKDASFLLQKSGFGILEKAIDEGGVIYALPLENITLSRKQIDSVNEFAKEAGLPGVVTAVIAGNAVNAPLSKFLTVERVGHIKQDLLNNNDGTILFAAAPYNTAVVGLGRLRLKLADFLNIPKKEGFHFLWVTDFPLFEKDSEGTITSAHHPFTAPAASDIALLDTDLLEVRSRSYDLVINGFEIASGSIRIHQRLLQEKIFHILGIAPNEAEEKFGYLLKAFEYGVPPHGGAALGFDRLVMLMCGKTSIREVIPFPKTTSGICLMDGAPAAVSREQLQELSIKVNE